MPNRTISADAGVSPDMTERKNALAQREDDQSAAAALLVLPKSAARADRDLVERSIAHIRDVLAKTVTRGMDEVGRYMLREFYDDDPELYLSASPNKHASLRLLIDRCESIDLPVSRTFLGNALRMAVVTKELPRDASFHRLPPSHRVELLRVKAPDQVERLAAKAVEARLSVQKLRALVQKEGERTRSGEVRGRKRRPEALRSIEVCLRALGDETNGRLLFRRSDIDPMTKEQLVRGRAALVILEKRVTELRRLLG
jgi:hypothetical protein